MKRITVLLADDNKFVRREFRRILEREDDFEVVGEAKNGLQAVAMVKRLHPALVLMDLAMPLLNGLQATCQILKTAAARTWNGRLSNRPRRLCWSAACTANTAGASCCPVRRGIRA